MRAMCSQTWDTNADGQKSGYPPRKSQPSLSNLALVASCVELHSGWPEAPLRRSTNAPPTFATMDLRGLIKSLPAAGNRKNQRFFAGRSARVRLIRVSLSGVHVR